MATTGVFPSLTVPFKLSVGSQFCQLGIINRPEIIFVSINLYVVEVTTLFKSVKKVQEILAKTLRNLATSDLTRVRLRDITMSRSMNLTIEGKKHKYLQHLTFFYPIAKFTYSKNARKKKTRTHADSS